MGMVELEPVEADEDISELKSLVEKHERFTGSTVARRVLNDWDASLGKFVKVMPVDYKRVLQERKDRETGIANSASVEESSVGTQTGYAQEGVKQYG